MALFKRFSLAASAAFNVINHGGLLFASGLTMQREVKERKPVEQNEEEMAALMANAIIRDPMDPKQRDAPPKFNKDSLDYTTQTLNKCVFMDEHSQSNSGLGKGKNIISIHENRGGGMGGGVWRMTSPQDQELSIKVAKKQIGETEAHSLVREWNTLKYIVAKNLEQELNEEIQEKINEDGQPLIKARVSYLKFYALCTMKSQPVIIMEFVNTKDYEGGYWWQDKEEFECTPGHKLLWEKFKAVNKLHNGKYADGDHSLGHNSWYMPVKQDGSVRIKLYDFGLGEDQEQESDKIVLDQDIKKVKKLLCQIDKVKNLVEKKPVISKQEEIQFQEEIILSQQEETKEEKPIKPQE